MIPKNIIEMHTFRIVLGLLILSMAASNASANPIYHLNAGTCIEQGGTLYSIDGSTYCDLSYTYTVFNATDKLIIDSSITLNIKENSGVQN